MAKPTVRDRAPHGYDSSGEPLAPYGLNMDGTPRKSNRGAKAGSKPATVISGVAEPLIKVEVSSLDDKQRKLFLTEISDVFIVGPLAGLSKSKRLERKIGARQTDALAADAYIFEAYTDSVVDGLIILNESEPSTLGWLDALADKAGWIALAQALTGLGRALVENHRHPNPDMAVAGRNLARVKIAQRAAAMAAAAREQERHEAERDQAAVQIPEQRQSDEDIDGDDLIDETGPSEF